MATILYLGSSGGTSGLRAAAFRRLGHVVDQIDPYQSLRFFPPLQLYAYKTGALALSPIVQNWVLGRLSHERYDVLFVDNGELIDRRLAEILSPLANYSILYNLDNPFTRRDGMRWRAMLNALPVYDLFVTPRHSSVPAACAAGARRAIRVVQAADEVLHRPIALSQEDGDRFKSDVAFVGTWMPERGPFLARLITAGVPISIFGPRWERAAEYKQLAPYRRSAGLNQSDYSKAIAGAKICLALLSKGNLDQHTTRSLEIPAIGSVLCGERTAEHQELYEENEEAIFWQGVDDCASKTLKLLRDPVHLEAVGMSGHKRIAVNQNYNEPTLTKILNAL